MSHDDSPQEQALLHTLARRFPGVDSALAEITRLSAQLALPKNTIHVISDVHGEDRKLRHVINNASGTLRPIVERRFADRLTQEQIRELLATMFYPAETIERRSNDGPDGLADFSRQTLGALFELAHVLTRGRTLERLRRVLPDAYPDLIEELLHDPASEQGRAYAARAIDTLIAHGADLRMIRLMARLVRNLAVDELIIAGDFWDRGPRGDRVIDYVAQQPNVAVTWGNHDAAWLGACVGQEALIAHVLRVSLRYRRLSQLEEGYGIIVSPLEALVRDVYSNDPAERFGTKGGGLRDDLTMARMQKAAAVMQFKLDGQTISRNPHFDQENRRLLHRLDPKAGTIEIDGKRWPLADTHLPTIDPADPYALSPAERACMDRIRQSFMSSRKLWEQACYVVRRGAMVLERDDHLIFHGCVPVDDRGEFLEFPVDGKPCSGRALFDAIDPVFPRALRDREPRDLDLLWYLWGGARSPLFGKDRITTLERYLVDDDRSHTETKNAYFRLIHEPEFCNRILAEFGVDTERGLIVNGHVPVKIEKGESPLKRSGKAITIDGAFSEAYGDHGYTLVLEPERTYLAEHHHFESVTAAIEEGVDIIPTCTPVREWAAPRVVADTERAGRIRAEIELLERLVDAYRRGQVRQEAI